MCLFGYLFHHTRYKIRVENIYSVYICVTDKVHGEEALGDTIGLIE